MIACLDVDYRPEGAVAACVCLLAWPDTRAASEHAIASATPPHPYVPGQLYLRELPYLLEVLAPVRAGLRVAVVDAFVWLGAGEKGIGAHLFDALGGTVPVVGIAKTAYAGATSVAEVLRGASARPIYVSAAGMDLAAAAEAVSSMAGPHRLPDLVKRADRLSRDAPFAPPRGP